MATLAPGDARAASAAVAPGSSAPIGPTVTADGTNFSVYSQRATGMDLLLFDGPAEQTPSTVLPLDRATNRTGGYWHGFVPGIGAGQVYAYRGRGPWAPAAGVFCHLDVMVNNAGMETRTSTLDTTEHQFDIVIGIDLKSAFFGSSWRPSR